jgi:hypothetical protein
MCRFAIYAYFTTGARIIQLNRILSPSPGHPERSEGSQFAFSPLQSYNIFRKIWKSGGLCSKVKHF